MSRGPPLAKHVRLILIEEMRSGGGGVLLNYSVIQIMLRQGFTLRCSTTVLTISKLGSNYCIIIGLHLNGDLKDKRV